MTKQACGIACLVAAVGSWSAARAEDAVAAEAPCAIEIARAPDDARAAIARWVAEEPRCGAPLTVRVVPTADGLYVLAEAADGRTFERVVPDAEAAGVLVASWAARVDERPAAGAPVAAPAVAPFAAPSAAGEPVDGGPVEAVPTDAWRGRWIEVAASVAEYDTVGVMASGRLALAGSGRWSVGLAADLRVASVPAITDTAMPDRRAMVEATAAIQGAWTLHAAAWRVRAELDLGFGGQRVYRWDAVNQVRAGLEVGRHLGGRWGAFVRGESTTSRESLGDVLHDATNFTEDTHWLGLAAGLATPL
ncbi:MAG: hypothetical protein JNK64_08365 [Myxococcales bacterium]|nr:hypothetical protein [Myxococcales bacterium]